MLVQHLFQTCDLRKEESCIFQRLLFSLIVINVCVIIFNRKKIILSDGVNLKNVILITCVTKFYQQMTKILSLVA